jgi:hypothetical protein
MGTALLLASLLGANCPRPPQKQRKTSPRTIQQDRLPACLNHPKSE